MARKTGTTPKDTPETPAIAAPAFPLPIPLDRLLASDEINVRRTARDADIEGLAESIAAKGLKQNLLVVPVVENATGDMLYEVTAGGRRWRALKLLAEQGRLPADHPVPCLVEEAGDARESSLDENIQRVAMNPADEFEAFAAIVSQAGERGSTEKEAVAHCAKRFGRTVAHVEGRLRLAALAPEILQALRDDAIGIEAAKAYATVGDRKLQLQVFKEREKDTWNGHKPQTIRERLRGKTLPTTDRHVLYVGLEAFVAAGGRVETEMFMGASAEERVVDVGKLHKMAKDKAEAEIPALAKAAGYKEGLYAPWGTWDAKWPRNPEGMTRAGHWENQPPKARRKAQIAVYTVAQDGSGLALAGRFKPVGEQAREAPGTGFTPPTPEEIAARRREIGVNTIAARLAVGKFAGSPFEGRAFWPANANRWIEPIEDINDDETLVAVLVKVSRAEIDAKREDAAAQYDRELAEEEAARAKEAAGIAEAEGLDAETVVAEMDDEDAEAGDVEAA